MSRHGDFDNMQHVVLDGRLAVWYDKNTSRIVMLDFDDDTGLSLSLDEWRRMVAWASQLAEIPDYYKNA